MLNGAVRAKLDPVPATGQRKLKAEWPVHGEAIAVFLTGMAP
jgi:hypothetical protein